MPSAAIPQEQQKHGSLVNIDNLPHEQLSPTATTPRALNEKFQVPQNTQSAGLIDFESSDDDMPLLPALTTRASSVPVPSAAMLGDAEQSQIRPTETTESAAPPRRALRARKPEQEMPYTLDLIRHRDQFRRRGLKPVHNPGEASHSNEIDDQYQGDDEEGVNDPEGQSPSPKEVRQHSPKRRRLQRDHTEEEEEQIEIRLRPGRRKFLDPRQFDVRRKPEPAQQVTPEQEVSLHCSLETKSKVSHFDFLSDDDFGFFPTPSSPPVINRLSARPQSPRQTATPISNSNELSSPNHNIPARIPAYNPISISSENSDSNTDSSSCSVQMRRRRHPSLPSSASPSSSDTEAINRLKKRARGVLPGSFFTVRAKPPPKGNIPRPATHNQDQDRRGVAKTKVSHTANKPTQFVFQASSSSEDEQVQQEREKRNFVDLTREETIQNDVEGWDIEEDLIDRMLGWGGRTNNRSHKTASRSKRSKTKAPSLQQKRKRQRRINEFTVPTIPKSKTSVKKKSLKLSIVDACDVLSAQGGQSPPQFMKIARRQSNTVKNFGRRKAPNRERFSFAEEDDQEDVNTVIDEWESGTIAEGLDRRPWREPPRQQSVFARSNVKRTPLAPLPEENMSYPENSKKPVDRFLRPGAPIIAIIDGARSRGRVVQRNATRPTGQIEGITKVRKARVSASARSRPRHPNDIVTSLRTAAERSQAHLEEDSGEYLDSMDISTPPNMTSLPRLRKPNNPNRRDVHKARHRISRISISDTNTSKGQQLSLDDVWFSNNSSSLTFGVLPIPEGTYLNQNTFIGRGLLSMALKTEVAAQDDSNLWRNVESHADFDVEQACERVGTDLDLMLSSIGRLRLSDSEHTDISRAHDQILKHAEFIISSLAGLRPTQSPEIQLFGSKILRLTATAMDYLDGTILSDNIDLSDRSSLLALAVLQTLLVGCYQLYLLTSRDVSMLEADEVICNLSRRLLQYLLRGGLDFLQQNIRKIRANSTNTNRQECDSVLLDVWSTLYLLLERKDEMQVSKVPTFWTLVETELGVKEVREGEILDLAWNVIFNISAITTIDADGIARAPSQRINKISAITIWNIVEAIIAPCLKTYPAAQHYRYDAYVRILFARCFTLISSWGWCFGVKSILTIMYALFTERRFDNLKTEGFGGFPKFFQSSSPLEIQTTDSTFVIFLKLLASYIAQQQSHLRGTSKTDRRQFLAASKDLDRFVNRITPLRTYQSEFSPLDYIALQNHYCLLLTLYWVAPGRSRPSIERIRDVIDIEKAPAPAQVICLETWSILMDFQLKKEEDITSSIQWFMVIFRHALKDYQILSRPANIAAESGEGVPAKSKIRALESILLKALKSLENVLPLAGQQAGQLVDGKSLVYLELMQM